MLIRRDTRFYPVVVEAVAALIGLPGVGWLFAQQWQLGVAIMFGYIILVGWLLGLVIGGLPIIGFPLTRNVVAAIISSVTLYMFLQRKYYRRLPFLMPFSRIRWLLGYDEHQCASPAGAIAPIPRYLSPLLVSMCIQFRDTHLLTIHHSPFSTQHSTLSTQHSAL